MPCSVLEDEEGHGTVAHTIRDSSGWKPEETEEEWGKWARNEPHLVSPRGLHAPRDISSILVAPKEPGGTAGARGQGSGSGAATLFVQRG